MNNIIDNLIRFTAERYCPNASSFGFNRSAVKVGDMIRFQTQLKDGSEICNFGRVLGLAKKEWTWKGVWQG